MAQAPDLPLPKGALLLHIGPYKTGSTALQVALHNARPQLAEHGVVYPGAWRRVMREGWAVLRWTPRARKVPPIAVWQELVREVREASDKRVCLSNEDFGSVKSPKAVEIVQDLGGERVHVVAVDRRFDKLLPSAWQERVKGYDPRSYDEWLRAVLDGTPDDPAHRAFWASHDLQRMVEQWAPAVGHDRFIVIVTDDSDRNRLLRAFEQMLGLPTGMLELGSESNPSLSMNAAELIRRVNVTFAAKGWPDLVYHHMMQRGVIRDLMYAPRSEVDQRIPPLPRWAVERIAELSEERISTINSLGVRVIGDPECLRVPTAGADNPAEIVPPSLISIDQAEAAVRGAVEGALRLQAQASETHARELRRVRGRVRALRKAARATPGSVAETAPEPGPPLIGQVPTRGLLAEMKRRVKLKARR